MKKNLNANDERYIYEVNGKKSSRVGQAVYDIMTQDQEDYSCEEIVDAFGPDYVKEFNDVVDKNRHKFTSPFYILVITKKEMWAVNILRNKPQPSQAPTQALSAEIQKLKKDVEVANQKAQTAQAAAQAAQTQAQKPKAAEPAHAPDPAKPKAKEAAPASSKPEASNESAAPTQAAVPNPERTPMKPKMLVYPRPNDE